MAMNTSQPSGAQVYLRRPEQGAFQRQGATPWRDDLEPGRWEVRLELEDYAERGKAYDKLAQVLGTIASDLPDPDLAQALITPRTRAIVLVTPNNPGGVEYPAELIETFAWREHYKMVALSQQPNRHATHQKPVYQRNPQDDALLQ